MKIIVVTDFNDGRWEFVADSMESADRIIAKRHPDHHIWKWQLESDKPIYIIKTYCSNTPGGEVLEFEFQETPLITMESAQ